MTNNDIFENIINNYKNKNFNELKNQILELTEDEVHQNLKLIVLSNCMLNVKEDGEGLVEEYSDLARLIISQKIDMNKKISVGEENYSIPYLTIMSGDVKVFKELIKNGLDINMIEKGANFLFHSITLKKNEMSHYLIDNDIDIMPFKDHPSTLNIAIVNFHKMDAKNIIFKMIDKGYNFENEYDNAENPILLSLKYDEDLTNKILDSNYKFSVLGGTNTPLELFSYASDYIKIEMFQKIVLKIKEDIVDVNYGIIKSIPALHIMIGKRKKDYLKILLDLGLDVNLRVISNKPLVISQANISGMTPLLYATNAGFNEIVDLLIEYDADPNIKDPFGNTVLNTSKNANRETFLSLMKSDKICLDENMLKSNTDYQSPLHFLAQINSELAVSIMNEILNTRDDITEALNRKTVFPENINIDGFTPLMLSCAVKNKDMILRLIKDERVDINSCNQRGSRAISELFGNSAHYFDFNNINSNEETMNLIEKEYSFKNENDDNITNDKNNTINEDEEILLISRKLIEAGAELDFKLSGVKFVKTLNYKAKKMIQGIMNKDKKSLFEKWFS